MWGKLHVYLRRRKCDLVEAAKCMSIVGSYDFILYFCVLFRTNIMTPLLITDSPLTLYQIQVWRESCHSEEELSLDSPSVA